MGWLRRLFESVVYAGMKPQGPVQPGAGPSSAWRQRFEHWLDRPANADPLYLSNRTVWQRMRIWVAVLTPVAVLLGVLTVVFSGGFQGREAAKPKELTLEEKAARILPNFNSPIQLTTNRDLDVQDVHVEHGPPTRVAGLVRNNTGRTIASAEMAFELVDGHGSRLGAVTTRVEKLPPHVTIPFRFAVSQDNAEAVLVRDYEAH